MAAATVFIQEARPRRVPGAIWQAGVTPGNAAKRVLLNGEPQPLAIAAGVGWVVCLPEPRLQTVKPSVRYPLGWAHLIDWLGDKPMFRGKVQIIDAAGE